jgi:pyruvate formate lyase activating enzyme
LCKLHEGQRGFCFVRACHNGQIILTSYGRSSGFWVDPIEKKPLHHFLPGTPVFSFGTAGCNLGCQFCQNWEISRSREIDTLAEEASPEAIAQAACRLACPSVAFTYNDPVVFMEYARDVAQACHQLGIRAVAVTAGYICEEPREEFFRFMDAANVDLKGFTESFYSRLCAGHLQPVLDTLLYLKHETSVWFEITHLLIPGENDSEFELEQLTEWIVEHLGPEVPVHFTAFYPAWKMSNRSPTPASTLTKARCIAVRNGVRYAYCWNQFHEQESSTYCHRCHGKLIGRDRYRIREWNLSKESQCLFCGAPCAGVFADLPGSWGPRSMPVRLAEPGLTRVSEATWAAEVASSGNADRRPSIEQHSGRRQS